MSNSKINIPSWAQGTVVVASIAAVGFIVYGIYKHNKNKKNLEGANKELKTLDDTVKKLAAQGQKATLDSTKITALANKIDEAMQGYGSNVNAIYAAFTDIKSDIDMLNLSKAFGIREISSGRGNPAPNTKGTLQQCLQDELSGDELKALNGILARSGIKYRF